MKKLLALILLLVCLPWQVNATTFPDTVKASTDDAYICGMLGWSLTGSGNFFGWTGSKPYVTGERYLNVTVPAAATIVSATWQTCSRGNAAAASDTVVFKVQCEDTADAETFPSDSGVFRTRMNNGTTAYATDTIIARVNGNYYTTVFTTALQELVNRPDWASGNDLSLIITGLSTSRPNGDDVFFQAWTWDGDSTKAGTIEVSYSAGAAAAITLRRRAVVLR